MTRTPAPTLSELSRAGTSERATTKLALAEAEKIIDLQPEKLTGYDKAARARRQLEGESAIEEDCDRMAGLEFDEPAEFHERANTMMKSLPSLRSGAGRLLPGDRAGAELGRALRPSVGFCTFGS